MDLKDYKNAIVYYKKELEQYDDNPSEVLALNKFQEFLYLEGQQFRRVVPS